MQNFEAFGKEKIEKLALSIKDGYIYSPLSPVTIGQSKVLTLPVMKKSNGIESIPVFTEEKNCPAPKLFHKSEKFFSSYFYSGRTSSLALNPQYPSTEEINTSEISALIGRLQENRAENSTKALNSSLFHLAAYLAIAKEKDFRNAASAFINLGFYEDAEKMLEHIDGDEKLVFKARILRGKGDIRGAGEAIAAIKDENFKAHKYIQYAWLLYLTGKIEEAKKIFLAFENSQYAQEALYAIALCMIKISLDSSYDEIEERLKKASEMSGEYRLNANAALGNICLLKKNYMKSLDFYSKAYAINNSLHILAAIGMALAQKGDFQESYDIACSCAAFNVNFATKIFSYIAPTFLSTAKYKGAEIISQEENKPLPPQKVEIKHETSPTTRASLDPSDISKRAAEKSEPPPSKPEKVIFESSMPESYLSKDNLNSISQDDRKGFISRAFSLSSRLEDEYNKKVYFNLEGLSDVERDLRLFYIQKNVDPFQLTERVKDAGAFICYMLKERYKARLVEIKDFDEWAWPCIISKGESEIITYPIARAWRIIWGTSLPDQGWTVNYFQYLSEEFSSTGPLYWGVNAVKRKVKSRPEKIFDASIEHKRILTLAQSLEEFYDIELARTGVPKIDREIKKRFKPDIPPTADGWRLLRCYAHYLTEILIKDFKAQWFNVEKNDGFWSMELPWRTYVFPIGKTFKSAATGENLAVFYDTILSEKLKHDKLTSNT